MKFRFLFSKSEGLAEMLDHEAATPEIAQNRAQLLIDMANQDYKTLTIYAEKQGKWMPIAILCKYL